MLIQNLPFFQPELGERFERLGKRSGIYLRYNNGNFTLVRRSYFHRLLEKVFAYLFGYQFETTLRFIVEKISRADAVPAPLREKLAASWRRAFPAEPCPLFCPQTVPPLPDSTAFSTRPYTLRVANTVLSLEHAEIAQSRFEAIVNPTLFVQRPLSLDAGRGTCTQAIFSAAGRTQIEQECCRALKARRLQRARDLQVVGRALPESSYVVRTSAGSLGPTVQYIFHLVCPRASNLPDDQYMNQVVLKLALREVLFQAKSSQVRTLAIPLPDDRWGYTPLDMVATWWEELQLYLQENPSTFDRISFVIAGTNTFFAQAKDKAQERLKPYSEVIALDHG